MFPFYILFYFQQFQFHLHLLSFSLAFISKWQVLIHFLGPTFVPLFTFHGPEIKLRLCVRRKHYTLQSHCLKLFSLLYYTSNFSDKEQNYKSHLLIHDNLQRIINGNTFTLILQIHAMAIATKSSEIYKLFHWTSFCPFFYTNKEETTVLLVLPQILDNFWTSSFQTETKG